MERSKKKNLFKLIIIALILTFFVFFISYPTASDFDYWHMEVCKVVEQTKYISFEDSNSGYYVLTVILHILTSISYDILTTLPIQLIPCFILLTAILKNIQNGFITVSIILYYLTTLSNPLLLTWSAHEIGFLLFLTILITLMIYLERKSISKVSISLMLVLLVIMVNFISYKVDFIVLSFLFIFSIVEGLDSIKGRKFQSNTFFTTVLIGFVVTLTFNMVFYNEFLPNTFTNSFEFSSGILKLFNFLHHDPSVLSPFLLKPSKGIIYARLFQYLLLSLSIFFSFIIITRKANRNQSLSSYDKIFLGLLISGSFLFIVYNMRGFADFTFLLFSGIIGFIIICNHNSTYYKKFVLISVLLLLATNFYVINEKINGEYVSGQSDYNHFEYLKPVTNWYAKYGIDKTNINTVSDVFTRGYFMKEFANKNRSNYPSVFNSSDILFLYKVENCKFTTENIKYRFIINYRENYFTIEDWKFFKSFSIYKKNIETNRYINSIYTSGDVVIYEKY